MLGILRLWSAGGLGSSRKGNAAGLLLSPKPLTGIEPAGYQFSSVQLGLSSCVFGLVQFATRAFRAVWMADVLPRCCPATRIRLLKIPIPCVRAIRRRTD